MCGIFCAVSCHKPIWPSPELEQLLMQRGPDSSGKHDVHVPHCGHEGGAQPSQNAHVTFFSTVLNLRGQNPVRQPCRSQNSQSTLCWNGEAWTIDGSVPQGNDTELVLRLLEEAARTPVTAAERQQEVVQRAAIVARQLARLAGPYAFVFYDSVNDMLCFGRDFLGRRSLLTNVNADGDLLISSVTDAPEATGWTEVEADGLYYIDLLKYEDHLIDTGNVPHSGWHSIAKVPYYSAQEVVDSQGEHVLPTLFLNKQMPSAAILLDDEASSVLRLEQLLRASLAPRILSIPNLQTVCTTDHDENAPRLAILFSGGLDCTVLARLAHDLLPATEGIDLLNVAFQNPRIHKHAADDADIHAVYELCPDRATGRSSYNELRRVCPDRNWKFIAINVPYTETMEHRQKVVTLMHPHNTEMDLSISYALYFASRGAGYLSPSQSELTPYTTSARVLLSGLGADELFGGYQRHATAYNRSGFPGLLDELDLDIGRLGKRNLGRDDRVISSWGREARFPYLDEQLLAWALDANVSEKCGFGEPAASDMDNGSELLEPGKKVLRCLAWKLGMRGVAKEKKRAIQFGARTAKMETGKTKGTTLLT